MSHPVHAPTHRNTRSHANTRAHKLLIACFPVQRRSANTLYVLSEGPCIFDDYKKVRLGESYDGPLAHSQYRNPLYLRKLHIVISNSPQIFNYKRRSENFANSLAEKCIYGNTSSSHYVRWSSSSDG